jgi:hypothetical protein
MSFALALFLLACGLAALAVAGESLTRGAAVIVVTLSLLALGVLCGGAFLPAADPIHAALARIAYGGVGFTALAVTAVLLHPRHA